MEAGWNPQATFATPEAIDIPTQNDIEFEVKAGALRYMCKFEPLAQSDRLIVSLGSYIKRPDHVPPMFYRKAARETMQAHVLSVFDPTLLMSPTIQIGCFIGTRNDDAMIGLLSMVKKVAGGLGIPASNVIYWGTSAASFGAVMAAARSGSGRAICVNPLLELPKYRWFEAGKPIMQIFGPITDEEVEHTLTHRFSTTAALRMALKSGGKPKIFLAQNELDVRFARNQFAPFCASWGIPASENAVDATGTIKTFLFKDPDGHRSEKPEIRVQMTKEAYPFLQLSEAPTLVAAE